MLDICDLHSVCDTKPYLDMNCGRIIHFVYGPIPSRVFLHSCANSVCVLCESCQSTAAAEDKRKREEAAKKKADEDAAKAAQVR